MEIIPKRDGVSYRTVLTIFSTFNLHHIAWIHNTLHDMLYMMDSHSFSFVNPLEDYQRMTNPKRLRAGEFIYHKLEANNTGSINFASLEKLFRRLSCKHSIQDWLFLLFTGPEIVLGIIPASFLSRYSLSGCKKIYLPMVLILLILLIVQVCQTLVNHVHTPTINCV